MGSRNAQNRTKNAQFPLKMYRKEGIRLCSMVTPIIKTPFLSSLNFQEFKHHRGNYSDGQYVI